MQITVIYTRQFDRLITDMYWISFMSNVQCPIAYAVQIVSECLLTSNIQCLKSTFTYSKHAQRMTLLYIPSTIILLVTVGQLCEMVHGWATVWAHAAETCSSRLCICIQQWAYTLRLSETEMIDRKQASYSGKDQWVLQSWRQLLVRRL